MAFRNSTDCAITENRIVDICKITEEDYICQSKKLLRIGPLWSIIRNTESLLCKLFECIAAEFYQIHKFICDLAVEANPCTAVCPETLDQWARIYGIDDCGVEITSELICKFAENRGLLTKEWLIDLAECEGYEIISIENSCQLGPEKELKCGTGFGTFPYFSGTLIEEINTECERKYSEYPCINCCPTTISEPLSAEQTCAVDRQEGGCAICNAKCENTAQFQYFGPPELQQQLCAPSTLVITIAGSSGCIDPHNFENNFGRPWDSNDFKLCLLETQIPAHICIIYEFEEEC